MDNKKFLAVRCINLVLIALAFVLGIYQFSTAVFNNVLEKVFSVVVFCSLSFGVVYFLDGYKKASATYYRGFMGLYALSTLCALGASIISLVKTGVFFPIIPLSVILVGAILLSFVKDLGKRNSFLIIGVCLVAVLVSLVVGLITSLGSDTFISDLVFHVLNLILSLTAGTFVAAKYLDKTARGTK